eukprot:224547-Rhodomonas_salina.1
MARDFEGEDLAPAVDRILASLPPPPPPTSSVPLFAASADRGVPTVEDERGLPRQIEGNDGEGGGAGGELAEAVGTAKGSGCCAVS